MKMTCILSTVLCLLVTSTLGCGPKPIKQSDQNSQMFSEQGQTTIHQILSSPEDFSGQTVTVTGTYMGWKGDCQGGPPLTRSDWMLTSGNECIYVSGNLPELISPSPPANDTGKSITIQGMVQIDQNGKAFIQIK